MNIPFVDLKAQYQALAGELTRAMAAVIAETAFIAGPAAKAFEDAFAAACGAQHCVGLGNGTDALIVALRAVGVGNGDEVAVPANSFVATSEAVAAVGANVVFIDVDPGRRTIDPADLAAKISPRTKAVIPVHLYGQPADMQAIGAVALRHGLKIVQDCAQAHAAAYDGIPLSRFGDVSCYSFYPGKNLGAYGDAGALVTDDPAIARFSRMYANHGRIAKYDHEFEGINSRLDGLQAAVLSVKLPHLEAWTERRRALARRYDDALADIPQVATPRVYQDSRHVYHLYVIEAEDRQALQASLAQAGVATGIHYPIALPFLSAYRRLGHVPQDFPVAHALQSRILSLPIYAEMTDDAAAVVATAIRAHYSAANERSRV